jgi:glycosyltransferase 2 family protein
MQVWFKNNRQLVLRGAGTVLAIVLLIILLYQSGWEDVSAALKRIPFWNLALAFGCIILSRLCITARWYVLLRSGDVKIPFKDAASLVFTGLFANNFLPTTIGGDVVRLAGAMQMGYDQAVCLASIAADRVVNMVGMSLASPLGLWQLFQAGALQSLALAGFWQKGRNFILKTLHALTLWLKKPSALFAALGFALAHMLFSFGANYILIQSLGGTLPLWKVIGLFSLAYFVSLIPISINGYGVQELTVTFLLSQFGGVSVPVSATVAVLHRLLMMVASLPGAFTLPSVLAKMDRSQASPAETGTITKT